VSKIKSLLLAGIKLFI